MHFLARVACDFLSGLNMVADSMLLPEREHMKPTFSTAEIEVERP
jgi:hypothetical protein